MTAPSPQASADASRSAVAMAAAASRLDRMAFVNIWRTTPDHPLLLWSLARLPGLIAEATATAAGVDIDVDSVLANLALGLAAQDPNTPNSEEESP